MVPVGQQLSPQDLAQHAPALAKLLEDPLEFVRSAACEALQKLSPEDLAQDAPALDKLWEDPSEAVRSAASGALQKLFPEDLAQHAPGNLQKLSLHYLARHALALEKLLEDPSGFVRSAACGALQKLSPQDLAQHAPALAKLLEDPLEFVRSAACEALQKLSPEDLAQHGPALAKLLEDPSEIVRRDAGKALGLLPWRWLQQHPLSSKHVDALIELLEEQMLEEELLPDVFKFPIEEMKQFEGSTWLHLAAASGKSRACRALTNAGLSLAHPNRRGQRPCDLAQQCGHTDLPNELQPSTLAIRGGTGKGIGEALKSEDAIQEITWWTLPLPPPTGWLGTRHSMLSIKVGAQLFLVESAAPSKKDEDGGSALPQQAARNGLYVSKWTDVQAAKDLERLVDVPKLEVKRPIQMTELLQHLLRMGKYDAGRNNCHHTAMNGYNFCAPKEHQLRKLPLNRIHTRFARSLSEFFGITLAPSGCCGQESGCEEKSRMKDEQNKSWPCCSCNS